MTNKDFFLEILNEEAPKFRKVIDALPEDKHGHKVHERARAAGHLAAQLGIQWKAISGIVTLGKPTFNPHEMESKTKEEMLAAFDEGMAQLKEDMQNISDEDWEAGQAGWGDEFHDKKYHMAWMFLFDAIHHRAQLATYLRAMGEVVPAIYGPSADMQS